MRKVFCKFAVVVALIFLVCLFAVYENVKSVIFTLGVVDDKHGNASHSKTYPNIVFILTDDQDEVLGGLTPMAKTKKYFDDHGVRFVNSFTVVPVCCPSRSSILTGLYQHNHKVLNNSVNGNCYGSLWRNYHETRTFVTYLKQQNYTTFFAGKYLNQYGVPAEKQAKYVPPGWDHWNGLVGNSAYYHYSLSVNGRWERHGNSTSDYLTDLINARASDFLESYGESRQPFFMMLSTPASHGPFTPSHKYTDAYLNLTAPRTPNFNMSGGPDKHWLLRQTPNILPENSVKILDGIYGKRWATLLSVDDMLENVVRVLTAKGLLENTYIFFTSDNGYHLGQFSLPLDKRQMYEFDIRVPLLVAGPGIRGGGVRQEPVVNVDLAPTFLELAGVTAAPSMDGRSLMPLLLRSGAASVTWRNDVLIEYHGEGSDAGQILDCPQYSQGGVSQCHPDCICEDAYNNTYACVRTITAQQNRIYCRFKDDESFVEEYDMQSDPWQLHNLAAISRDMSQLSEHESQLESLRKCQGRSCQFQV